MVNLDTDIAIVSKNADKKMYPASTTKIMTAVVSLANIEDLDDYAEVPQDAFDEFESDNPNLHGASTAGIVPLQSNITYRDLLYALILPSACEASNILAYNVGGGSIENFIAMMNETAEEIGCENTHFSNAHGLFAEDHYTTAYDMYLITKYAMDNFPLFMEICDTRSYDMPPNSNGPDGYTVSHTNSMMQPSSKYYYEGVHGIKTGRIDKYFYQTDGVWDPDNFEYGHRSLVTTAQREGSDGRDYSYMIVTLGAPDCLENGEAPERIFTYTDHINLYDWAFDEFVYTDVVLSSEQVAQIGVDKGKDADKVGVITAEDFYTLLPKTLDISAIQQIRNIEEMLEAPVEKGTAVGDLELRLNGETLGRIKLVTESDIELDTAALYAERIKDFISAPQFIAVIVVLALLVVALAAVMTVRRSRRKAAELDRRRKVSAASSQGRNNGLRK